MKDKGPLDVFYVHLFTRLLEVFMYHVARGGREAEHNLDILPVFQCVQHVLTEKHIYTHSYWHFRVPTSRLKQSSDKRAHF